MTDASDPAAATGVPTQCAPLWRAQSRPAFGTAPMASFWVAVEQPGPWGRKAFTESRLDPDLGRRLDADVSHRGGRAVLVRRPDSRADHDAARTLLVATGLGLRQVLGRRVVAAVDLAAAVDELLAELDVLVAGRLPQGFQPASAALLVCSNGKRDQCCAVEARPLLRDLLRTPTDSDADPAGDIWEATHLNGHRFAPTAVALPTGQMAAWLDADQARALLGSASAGLLWSGGVTHERGRTHLAPGVQAVDVHLRALIGERGVEALSYCPDPELGTLGAAKLLGRTLRVDATHLDGRRWRFELSAAAGAELPESCGKQAVPTADWVVREVPGAV